MPIDLRCDRCNKKITTVSYDKIREFVQRNGETCKKSDSEVRCYCCQPSALPATGDPGAGRRLR